MISPHKYNMNYDPGRKNIGICDQRKKRNFHELHASLQSAWRGYIYDLAISC